MTSARLLRYLEALIAFDTQNPPRRLSGESLLMEYLRSALGTGFTCTITDHGKGRVSFLAVRGDPDLLFNVHLDTVPVLDGARFAPLTMTVHDGRVFGRGACDIKGAAACLLTVARESDVPLALLFTTDEEGAEGCCVTEFVAAGRANRFRQVIVAEPTGCLAEVIHRGYLSVTGVFTGEAGHSSEQRTLEENAIHRMARWSAAALHKAKSFEDDGLRSCFNIGTVDGGVKSNVIADRAALHWSARLLPGQSNARFLEQMRNLEAGVFARWEVPFSGPPLPTGDNDSAEAERFALDHGLELGTGLDFWTEASLFSAAGIPALVFGPGHIAQAHVVDEWVGLDQLGTALDTYRRLVGAHA
jgi:acetylornithine deacetylase